MLDHALRDTLTTTTTKGTAQMNPHATAYAITYILNGRPHTTKHATLTEWHKRNELLQRLGYRTFTNII